MLHADVSAIIARDIFGVNDEEVLQAIANHTLDRSGVSPLSCIVFLSDSLEPGRGNTLELQAFRKISVDNLDRAVRSTYNYTITVLLESSCLIHPRVMTKRNWFLQQWKSNGTRCRS